MESGSLDHQKAVRRKAYEIKCGKLLRCFNAAVAEKEILEACSRWRDLSSTESDLDFDGEISHPNSSKKTNSPH